MKTSGTMIMWFFFTTTAPALSFFSFPMTIHSVLNTFVKVSGGAHHHLPRKTSLKLYYVMLVRLGYLSYGQIKIISLGYGYVMDSLDKDQEDDPVCFLEKAVFSENF